MCNYTQMNPTLTQTTILNTLIKSDISTLPLTPPKNHINIFKNQMLPLKPPHSPSFHQYTSFTTNLYLQRYGPISTSPHIFHTSKFELFDLMNSKIQTLQIPSSNIIPKTKLSHMAQKIPNWFLCWLSNCCVHTFGRPCWQVIWFGSHWFGLLLPKAPKLHNPPQITWKVTDMVATNIKAPQAESAKRCVHLFHGQDEDQFWIFWALLVHFGLGMMWQEGFWEIQILEFFWSKSSKQRKYQVWMLKWVYISESTNIWWNKYIDEMCYVVWGFER